MPMIMTMMSSSLVGIDNSGNAARGRGREWGEERRVADRVSHSLSPVAQIQLHPAQFGFDSLHVNLETHSTHLHQHQRHSLPPPPSPPSSMHCPLLCHRSATLRAPTLAMHFHFHFHFPESLVINGEWISMPDVWPERLRLRLPLPPPLSAPPPLVRSLSTARLENQ